MPPLARFGDRRTVGQPYGSVEGLLMFRGNPSRTFYGRGPVPGSPQVLWRFPDRAMCGNSTHKGQPRVWCGTGWTGQPVVWERPDGIREVIFGSYDFHVYFLDASSGTPSRAPFRTGDMVKGSPTLDPDGFPLLYFGSRDNLFRIVALDRSEPTELWSVSAYDWPIVWNNDWDGNPAVVDDILFEGGENSWFLAWKLNRRYGPDGLVQVDPQLLIEVPGWTDELRALVGRELSIENSVAIFEGRAYFANSGGRVVGLDVTGVDDGQAPVVFDYWVGDDVDATITVDGAGALYVAVELQRFNARSDEIGQLVKLDPYHLEDPYVWGVHLPELYGGEGGIWATPALGDGVLYAATHPGELLAVETETGAIVWRDDIGPHAWSSPVLVDQRLVVAVDCLAGGSLRAYDVSDPRRPVPSWELPVQAGCIESTPAVWDGGIFVGSRGGFFYGIGDA